MEPDVKPEARPASARASRAVTSPAWVTIEPSRGWRAVDLAEVWGARELALTLALRDLRVRYKQTAVGIGWALFQPLVQTAIFAVVFGRLVGVPTDGVPYVLFALSALVLWQSFAKIVSEGSTSLVANQALLTKVYFPRVLMPLTSVLTALVDLAITLPVLLGVVLVFGGSLGPALLAAPLFVLLAAATAFSVAIWLSALDVAFRDVRFLLTPLVQVWMYATPIIYPTSLVPERWRALYALNPMTCAVDGFRWSVLGTPAPDPRVVGAVLAGVALALAGGLLFFARMDRVFADRV
jgi:lipopolysaccharide transport system permease protein